MRVVRLAFLSILLAVGATGCSTVKLNDLDYSLLDIQNGVATTMPKGVARVSPNRRMFTSKYFDPETIDADRTTDRGQDIERERAYVIELVLGDRRPYDVEIEVIVEEDVSGGKTKKNDDFIEGKFERVGSDKGLAKYYRDRLANYLARIERTKNLIDDFRPF